jgi:hypothetical protein
MAEERWRKRYEPGGIGELEPIGEATETEIKRALVAWYRARLGAMAGKGIGAA